MSKRVVLFSGASSDKKDWAKSLLQTLCIGYGIDVVFARYAIGDETIKIALLVDPDTTDDVHDLTDVYEKVIVVIGSKDRLDELLKTGAYRIVIIGGQSPGETAPRIVEILKRF